MVKGASAPVDDEVAAAIAMFFHGGAGPSHAAISRVLTANGYSDGYEYNPSLPGTNKENRVLRAFSEARRAPRRARGLVDGLLGLLRLEGAIGAESEKQSASEATLRGALGRSGWYLTADGQLRAFSAVDVETGGRAALDEQVQRLRRTSEDPGLLIGTAKELLESVAKFVLEESGLPIRKMEFDGLWHVARERLGILPQQVDQNIPGFEEIRAIHQSTWAIAERVNRLRNLQGTGHGRTLPTGVTEDLALLVVREACSVAEYMLSLLDKSIGVRR